MVGGHAFLLIQIYLPTNYHPSICPNLTYIEKSTHNQPPPAIYENYETSLDRCLGGTDCQKWWVAPGAASRVPWG